MKFEKLAKAKNILIYGYGVEGKSNFTFLSQKFPEKNIEIFDENIPEFSESKNLKSNTSFGCLGGSQNECCPIPGRARERDGVPFAHFDCIVTSPGIPRTKLTNVPEEKFTSNTEIFFENLPESARKKVIGISGTKGKSTTVKFCAEVLQSAEYSVKTGGNYTPPLLDLFDDFVKVGIDFLVAELSSFQLEHLKVSPHIAIFLSFFPDHIDRHGEMEKYFEAKKNLWAHQTPNDFLIVPENLILPSPFGRGAGGEGDSQLLFSHPIPSDFFPETSVFRAPHFLENFGTVVSLLNVLKVSNPHEVLKKIAKKFRGLPHRLEFFAEKNGIQFFDDSIATNPESSIVAVKFFGKNLGSIILGGQFPHAKFESLLEAIRDETDALVLLPDTEVQPKILAAAEKINFPVERIIRGKDLAEIVKRAFEKTPPHKACLLSPAAKSLDQFKNYRERGDAFKKLVREF